MPKTAKEWRRGRRTLSRKPARTEETWKMMNEDDDGDYGDGEEERG